MTTPTRSAILGLGISLPETILSNADFERMVDTNDEWITSRTGIKERRRLADGESITEHGKAACERAMADAGLTIADIGMILVCTYTPETMAPSVACTLHNALGASNIPAADLNAACSGFMYGLQMADSLVRTGTYKNILVLGMEGQTRYVDYSDRGTCILFGDGAGAAVIGPAPAGSDRGIYATCLGADGRGKNLITIEENEAALAAVPAGIQGNGFGQRPNPRVIRMQGREVFKFAVRAVGSALDEVLLKAGMTAADVDLLVPHQANIRIIDAAADRLSLPRERVAVNIQKVGNTAAASIPLALADAREQGLLTPGTTVALVGFGAGFTYGSVILKW